MIITYNPDEGLITTDGRSMETAERIIAKGEDVTVAQELIITAIRVLIFQGKANHKDIIFAYKHMHLYVDKEGNLDEWPIGFCDISMNYITILCNWEMLKDEKP